MADERKIEYQVKVTADTKGAAAAAAAIKQVNQAATQATGTTAQSIPVDNAAAKAKEEVAKNAKKSAATLDEVKRAGGPAMQIMQGLRQASAGGAQSFSGLANAGRGLVAAFAGGFGPAGIFATAGGVIGGLALAFGEKLLPEARNVTKEIDEIKAAVERLNQANIDQINQKLATMDEGTSYRIKELQLELDLRKQILAQTSAAQIAEINATPDSVMSKGQKAEAIAAVQLNQKLAEASNAVERHAIEKKAADEKAANAAKAMAELQQERLFALQKLAADETARARMVQEWEQLQGRLAQLQNARRPSGYPGSESSAPTQEEVDIRDRLSTLRDALEQFGGEVGTADAEARRKALEELDKQIEASKQKLDSLQAAAGHAARELEQVKGATGTVGTPGSIKGEIGAQAGADQLGRSNDALKAEDEKAAEAQKKAAKEDFARVVAEEEQRRKKADRQIAKTAKTSPFDAAVLQEQEAARRAEFDAFRKAAEERAEKPPAHTVPKPNTSQGGLNKGTYSVSTPGADVPATPIIGLPEGTAIIKDKDGNIVTIPARASGGTAKKGEETLVGEDGAELFTPADDGFISSNAEATSGDRAPTKPSTPRVIRSNAEALAESALESAAWAARNGSKETGYGFDGSDRAAAGIVRDFAANNPERWAEIVADAQRRSATALGSNLQAIQAQNAQIIHYLRELVFQGKTSKVA